MKYFLMSLHANFAQQTLVLRESMKKYEIPNPTPSQKKIEVIKFSRNKYVTNVVVRVSNIIPVTLQD